MKPKHKFSADFNFNKHKYANHSFISAKTHKNQKSSKFSESLSTVDHSIMMPPIGNANQHSPRVYGDRDRFQKGYSQLQAKNLPSISQQLDHVMLDKSVKVPAGMKFTHKPVQMNKTHADDYKDTTKNR